MDNIEQELANLHPEDQIDSCEDDLSLFKKSKQDKKKKKKNKLFSEIDKILEEDGSDDEMMFASSYKSRKKKELDADGDIFDTSDKGSKKVKSIEAKFKPELANLQKLLKDNDATVKMIKDVLTPIMSSKARGSSKFLVDLFLSLNSANNNRLSTIKEISNVKKAIYDLKIKMEKDNKDASGLTNDQFGSAVFDALFKQGRSNVIDTANSYNQDLSSFASSSRSFEEMCDERLGNVPEEDLYRSEEGNRMIQYESLNPEVCITKSFNTGDIGVIAIDKDGNKLEDYPIPTLKVLGKLTFNNEAGTCTDFTGRVFRVIDVE